MVRKKKKTPNKKGSKDTGGAPRPRGLELGDVPRVMAITDTAFNDALRACGIAGCAYGFQGMDGASQPVPTITLVGKDKTAFARAYEHLARWGCENDGDVVDIHFVLKTDGTYELWIGPEIDRAMYRTIPKRALFQAMSLNLSWVKRMDSTHEMVYELKEYAATGIRPVFVGAAVTSSIQPSVTGLQDVREWKPFVKFRLAFVDQKDSPTDPRFAARRNAGFQTRNPGDGDSGDSASPSDIRARRNRVLDVAFPVSRERVRRLGLMEKVKRIAGFESVSDEQVFQAVANLAISAELVAGDHHYSLVKGDFMKKAWASITNRSESADGRSELSNLDPSVIATQIELDVRAALRKQNSLPPGTAFTDAQNAFRKAGYVNE